MTPISLARKAIRWEFGLWRGIYLWSRRRVSGLTPGDTPLGYAGATAPIMWALIILNAIEIPALHIMIPWETVRFVVDIAGVYSLVWMVGLLALMKVHPHLVTGAGLRVRHGASIDFTVPWQAISGTSSRIRSHQGLRTVRVEDSVVQIGVGSQTNVDLVLREPLVVPLRETGGEPVTEIRVYADDPAALIAAVKSGRENAPPTMAR